MNKKSITVGKKRENIVIELANGKILQGPIGISLEEIVRFNTSDPFKYVTAVANGHLRSLCYQPKYDQIVEPLDLKTSEGVRVYRRSVSMLMVTAISELFPSVEVNIEHSVPFGGYFCEITNREKFSKDELGQICEHMRSIVALDQPIRRMEVTLEEAKEILKARGEIDKIKLLDRRNKDFVSMHELRGRMDRFYGHMVPSTGYLKNFQLLDYNTGFLLQYIWRPDQKNINKAYQTPRLNDVFLKYGQWLKNLKIANIGNINDVIASGRIREVIMASEALQEREVARIAAAVAKKKVKLVLIAGPSSSGKTTFSKRLAIQMIANGVQPFTLELDRYFVNRDKTPRDANGEYDFESIDALDVELLNSNLNDLMQGKKIRLPKFNFVLGQREKGPEFQLSPDQVIVAEGIHGLNPKLVGHLPAESIIKIYISPLTQLNIDRHNRIATTDTRLIRRIVRDANHRGWSAADTINMWKKVRRGEKRNIFPFQEKADEMFNSALVYELAALKPLVMPLLLQVKGSTHAALTARRLIEFLRLSESIDKKLVPRNSLLSEFTGDSLLADYLPGKHFDE